MSNPSRYHERHVPTFDLEKVERLLALLRQGFGFKDACQQAHLVPDTVREWMRKGGDPVSRSRKNCHPDVRVEPYWTFVRNVRTAMDDGKHRIPPGPPRGRRPADITPEQRTAVLRGIAAGWPFPLACRHAHLPYATFVSWLRLGGFPRKISIYREVHPDYIEEPYKTFVADVLAAEEAYFAT